MSKVLLPVTFCLSTLALCLLTFDLHAQQLLDRVVAWVDGYAITLTDLTAATALGLVDASGTAERPAIGQLIDRQLVLAEVARFAPPEPSQAAIAAQVASMTARVGDRLEAVMAGTGIDRARIRDMARDTLRIEAYLNQRFGTSTQLSEDEVLQYYRIHPEEFTRDGTLMPFDAAAASARERAAEERRATTVAQWMRDLHGRAEITIPSSPRGAPRAY